MDCSSEAKYVHLTDVVPADLAWAWELIRKKRPLVYHVTNAIAVAFQANVCLAIGASPIMSQHPREAGELAGAAQGFLVNTGTPTDVSITSIRLGMEAARGMTLLDPVGYGGTRFRTQWVDSLLKERAFSIVKGNEGEISLMAGSGGVVKGVDSLSPGKSEEDVVDLARQYGCVACATGKVDYLSDGESVASVFGGSPLLPYLSGSGCAVGTVALAAASACGDSVLGALCGLVAMAVASERAEKNCDGCGTFAPRLLDELYRLSPEDLADESKGSRLSIFRL
jgi:hydroxyethylthiazole kinase